jgi:hypothetical protein
MTTCRICHKPRKDAISVKLGIGPVRETVMHVTTWTLDPANGAVVRFLQETKPMESDGVMLVDNIRFRWSIADWLDKSGSLTPAQKAKVEEMIAKKAWTMPPPYPPKIICDDDKELVIRLCPGVPIPPEQIAEWREMATAPKPRAARLVHDYAAKVVFSEYLSR